MSNGAWDSVLVGPIGPTGPAGSNGAAGAAGAAGPTGPTWSPPTISFTAPSLLNSWVNYGSGYMDAGYCKDALGFVHIRGTIKSGTISQPCFNLPAGYRPIGKVNKITDNGGGAISTISVETNGDVVPSGGNNGYCLLDALYFLAET